MHPHACLEAGAASGAVHLVADLAPERERLQHVVVLPLVAVRQPRAAHAPADRQARSRLHRARPAWDHRHQAEPSFDSGIGFWE